jgi:hypothetical protein
LEKPIPNPFQPAEDAFKQIHLVLAPFMDRWRAR